MANDVRSLVGVASSVAPKPAYAVDSLYDDILLSIFFSFHQECIASPDGYAYDSLYTTRTSPWVLSHVCRHWRTLVISTPRLWTSVHLDTNSYISHFSAPQLLLEIVLQRSRDLELDVQIEDAEELSDSEDRLDETRSRVYSLVRLLRPTTARWRHLDITSTRDVFDAFAGCSFERLRSLALCYCWDVDEDKPVITLFKHATKLSELTLDCRDVVDIDLPWAGIHTFSTACSGLLFLPGMLALRILHLKTNGASVQSLQQIASEWEGIPCFELPLLQTITVCEADTKPIISNVSRRLRVPSLTTLVLKIWNHAQTNSLAPRLHFPVFENLGSLMNLSLDFSPFNVTNIEFFARTPSVTNIYLGPNAATLAVMEAIGLGVLPRLQTLGLHFSTWQKSPDAMISMISRRALNPHSACPIALLKFARFGPSDEPFSRSQHDGWNGWLSREVFRVQEGAATRWEAVLDNVDVAIVERYCFDL